MDWQTYTAIAIAVIAGTWAGWKTLTPIIREFRKKKSADTSCCGCGPSKSCGPDKPAAK